MTKKEKLVNYHRLVELHLLLGASLNINLYSEHMCNQSLQSQKKNKWRQSVVLNWLLVVSAVHLCVAVSMLRCLGILRIGGHGQFYTLNMMTRDGDGEITRTNLLKKDNRK